MTELSGSAPLRGTAHRAARPPAQTTQEGATARTARLFNRELGELNRLQRAAQQKGEVVTEAEIELEYEPRGPRLVAKDASTNFTSKEPSPTPAETKPADDGSDKPLPAREAETTPAVVAVIDEVAERVTRLNQTLSRALPPAGGSQPAEPFLDATA